MQEYFKTVVVCFVICLLFVFGLLQRGVIIEQAFAFSGTRTDMVAYKNISECNKRNCVQVSGNCSCPSRNEKSLPILPSEQPQTISHHEKLTMQLSKLMRNFPTRKTAEFTECTNQTSHFKFDCKVHCSDMPLFKRGQERTQLTLDCYSKPPKAKLSTVNNIGKVETVNEHSNCLSDYIQENCLDQNPVPNIVHYIWFSKHEMNFYHFLSAVSASRYLRPCLILYHGDFRPFGLYWDYLLHLVPNIIHVQRNPPKEVYGKRLANLEHKADVARIQTLQKYGGIYLDTDEIILRSLNPLRKYPFTLSHALDDNLSNGLILSERNAAFLNLWFKKYKTYTQDQWAYHSTILPYHLSNEHPDLIHVENKTFVRPNYTQLPLLFKMNFDWSKNYAIHLYIRFYKIMHNFNDVKNLNTTMGSVARHVLYGNKELCL